MSERSVLFLVLAVGIVCGVLLGNLIEETSSPLDPARSGREAAPSEGRGIAGGPGAGAVGGVAAEEAAAPPEEAAALPSDDGAQRLGPIGHLMRKLFRDGNDIPVDELSSEEEEKLETSLSKLPLGAKSLCFAKAGIRVRGDMVSVSGAGGARILPPRIRATAEYVRRALPTVSPEFAKTVAWLGERYLERRRLEVAIFERIRSFPPRDDSLHSLDSFEGYVVADGGLWLLKQGVDPELDAMLLRFEDQQTEDWRQLGEQIQDLGFGR